MIYKRNLRLPFLSRYSMRPIFFFPAPVVRQVHACAAGHASSERQDLQLVGRSVCQAPSGREENDSRAYRLCMAYGSRAVCLWLLRRIAPFSSWAKSLYLSRL